MMRMKKEKDDGDDVATMGFMSREFLLTLYIYTCPNAANEDVNGFAI